MVFSFAFVLLNGCALRERGGPIVPEPAEGRTIAVPDEKMSTVTSVHQPLWLSISHTPTYAFTAPAATGERKVKPVETPWAPAWDKEQIVRRLDQILQANGIASKNVRVRMIAHAVVASGWSQKIWNYNAWGVKQGGWEGSYYIMPTVEYDDAGNAVMLEHETWRSFNSWQEAIADFTSRIHPESDRPAWRAAHEFLTREKVSVAAAVGYWESLGAGNYYTATKFTGEKFARLCATVRSCLP